MTEQIEAVECRAFKPGASSPFIVLSDSIVGFDLTESAQDAIDGGSIEIENTDGVIDASNRITSGDKIEIHLQLVDDISLSRYATLIARDVSDALDGGGLQRVSVEVTDFVFSLLSFRTADASFEDIDAATAVTDLVESQVPAVGTSKINKIDTDVTLSVNGRFILDVIQQDIEPVADAVMSAVGTDLRFEAINNVSVKHQLTFDDIFSPVEIQRVDDELINRVRIDGSTETALDDSQTTQSATVRVTDTSRQTVQAFSRKSEVAAIEIFTVPDSTAKSGLTVRLQAAQSGSAVDPTDTGSDIARRTLAPSFLAQSDFTRFLMPSHTLAPAENPFIIIEGVGQTGHDIGTDGNGNVTFKSFFPFPLLARAESGQSQQQFRRRDFRRRDDQLDSEQAVNDAAQGELRHRTEPKRRISAQAASPRAHQLQPGDAVRVSDISVSDVSGVFIVTERQIEFANGLLRTGLTLEDANTI